MSYRPGIILCLILSSFFQIQSAHAGPGDLLVSPVRVVFEGRTRVAEVTLVNKGDSNATYRIKFENRRMLKDGSFIAIEEPADGEQFAEGLVRYAPRRIQLEPNAPQTLRLMLRKPADLINGEYRSHLHFAAVPDDAGSASIEAGGNNDQSISIKLTPVYGVTIPIIVRHGTLDAEALMRDIDIERNADGSADLSFVFERVGNKSLYGDFALHLAGEDEPVYEKRGVALYTPNIEREMTLSLPPEVASQLAGKPMELVFQDRTESGRDLNTRITLGSL